MFVRGRFLACSVCVVGYLETQREWCTEGSEDQKTMGKVDNAVSFPRQ